MPSVRRQTAQAFLDYFNDLDVDGHLFLRTPECRHIMAPASLGHSEHMSNEQFAAHLTALRPILSAFPVVAKEMTVNDADNQVVVWATGEAIFRDEVKDDDFEWKYHGEYIFWFTLTAEGDRIERIVEFLDSAKVVEVRRLLDRARLNLARK